MEKKQSKLYTEEQLRDAIAFGNISRPNITNDDWIKKQTPKELLSDEEIEIASPYVPKYAMSNKKQSSIDWLVEQLIPNAMRMFDATTCNAIEQAKAMEKEERFQDFKEGFQAAVESLQGANNLVQSKKLGGNNE